MKTQNKAKTRENKGAEEAEVAWGGSKLEWVFSF